MTTPRHIGLLSLGTPYFDLDSAHDNLRRTRAQLEQRFTVDGPDDILLSLEDVEATAEQLAAARVRLLVVQCGTFPDGEAPARLAEILRVPIVVHSVPEPDPTKDISLNSLCGANITTFTLSSLHYPHVWVHGAPGEEQVLTTVEDAWALVSLQDVRIGLFGARAPGFYPCAFDETVLRRTFGLAVEHISLHELMEHGEEHPRKPAPAPQVQRDGTPLDEAVLAQLEQRYWTLSDALERHGHCDAFAIKDWNELWGIWPQLGWLADDGHVIGVEGDMHGTITMLLNARLTDGAVPFLADVSAFDADADTLTLWHYGGAPSLARSPEDVAIDETGNMVEFGLKPGRVTMARIGYHEGGLRLLTIDAEVLDQDVHIGRAGALVRPLRSQASDIVETMLDEGWDHHVHVAYGDLSHAWRVISKLTGIPWTRL